MRPMTEAQAWAYLAKQWDNPHVKNGEAFILIEGRTAFGLCPSTLALEEAGVDVWAMRTRRADNKPASGEYKTWWWPLTRAGARSRATFCRRMSKLAAKEARGR